MESQHVSKFATVQRAQSQHATVAQGLLKPHMTYFPHLDMFNNSVDLSALEGVPVDSHATVNVYHHSHGHHFSPIYIGYIGLKKCGRIIGNVIHILYESQLEQNMFRWGLQPKTF